MQEHGSRVGGVTARLIAPPLLPSPPIRGVTEPEGSQTMTQRTKTSRSRPKFNLGKIVATPGALAACSPAHLNISLHRHSRGDWGDISAEDKALNDQSLVDRERVLSAYVRVLSAYAIDTSKPIKDGENCLWIITEWKLHANSLLLSETTLLLPDEY